MRRLVLLCLLALPAGAADPAWLHSELGEPPADWVPAPYRPVQRQGARLQVIGRTVELAPSGLPSSLTAAGAPLLAAPVALRATTPAGPLTWRWGPLGWGPPAPREQVWLSTAQAGDWHLQIAAGLAYDGLLTLVLRLDPPDGGGTLSSLALDVPLRPERARYFSFWPGQWGSAANSGPLPAAGLALPFKPLLWCGDEDRGLSVCAEDDEGWQPTAGQALTVGPSGQRRLTVNLVASPVRLERPWQTRLLLQPTPLKPFPADPHALRINHGGSYGLETAPWSGHSFQIRYDAGRLLDDRQGSLELTVTPGFDPQRPLQPGEVASRGSFNRELLKLQLPNGDEAGLYWNIDDRGMRYYVRRGREHPLVAGAPNGWRQGQTHTVALTWGDALRIWVDGQVTVEQPFAGLLGQPTDLTGATLLLGGDTASFAVHALRLERTARTVFHPEAEPTRTAETTLLEVGRRLGSGGTRQGGTWIRGRFGEALAGYDPAQPALTRLDALRAAGVRTLICHESWTDIQDYGVTPYAAELRSLAAACHDRGLKLLVYFGYELSDRAPEWAEWHEQALVAPRQGGYQRQPQQTAYTVCYNSVWQNFLLEQIAHAVREYGVDGVYLDGTIEPWGCSNAQHGCGYVGPDGQRRPTWPIRAVRRLMERMHCFLTLTRGSALIDAHQSLCLMTPTLSWCSGYWDGEQLTSNIAAGQQPLEYLPLATFRAEFMGRQFGVPAMFLNYAGRPFQPSQAMAFSLLHDVLPRGSGLDAVQAFVTPVWRAFDRFGRAGARFYGYWDPALPVSGGTATVKVSAWVRSGGELLVVSNLGQTAAAVDLGFRRRPLRAVDALTGQVYPLTAGRLRLTLPTLGYRLITLH
ncbi:MAG: hypothetical protein IT204_16140 [Fimbriimonadaceae bacterium]|nr:hypothetical protein [Fimbriimonadaceae bacterium]